MNKSDSAFAQHLNLAKLAGLPVTDETAQHLNLAKLAGLPVNDETIKSDRRLTSAQGQWIPWGQIRVFPSIGTHGST